MKPCTFLILVASLALFSTDVLAQKLEKVTGLQLEYWRAFHGLIKQEVFVTLSGEIALDTTITPPQKHGGPTPNSTQTVKMISARDLAPVLTFFNYADARQFFVSAEPVVQPDGALLSVTVDQNSFSIAFSSQTAFSGKTSRYNAALGRVALALFKLAGVTIPKDELY